MSRLGNLDLSALRLGTGVEWSFPKGVGNTYVQYWIVAIGSQINVEHQVNHGS